MLIRIDCLRLVITIRLNNESVIGVNVPCFVRRMMPGTNAIDVASPCATSKGTSVVLRSRWEGEIHKMGDRSLAAAAVGIPHGSLVGLVSTIATPALSRASVEETSVMNCD